MEAMQAGFFHGKTAFPFGIINPSAAFTEPEI
jgi:hypothetical protein